MIKKQIDNFYETLINGTIPMIRKIFLLADKKLTEEECKNVIVNMGNYIQLERLNK